MRLLITGASGFIGSNLTKKLKERKINFSNLTRKKNIKKLKGYKNILISKNIKSTERKILNFKPDIVVHLATNFQKSQNLNLIPKIVNDNITFGSLLLEILKKTNLKLFLNINTTHTSVNGKNFDPKDFYSSTKKSFENILYWYSKIYKINVINLHLADTYGSSDKRNKIINEIFKSAKYNKNIKLNFPNQEINYTHIDDVVNAIIFLIKKNKKKRWLNYNLYSKETLTLINLAKKIESTINKKIIVYSNSKYKLKNKKFKFKTRYKNIPGWKQKISLLKGLKKYFNNYKNDPKN